MKKLNTESPSLIRKLELELEQIITDMGYRRGMCTPRAREILKLLEELKGE